MPAPNDEVRSVRANPLGAWSRIRTVRRRRQRQWVWIVLSITGAALTVGIASIVRFDLEQTRSSAGAQKSLTSDGELVRPTDSNSLDQSTASVAARRSVRTVLDLSRTSPRSVEESAHFRPAVAEDDSIESADDSGVPPGGREPIQSEPTVELDRAATVPPAASKDSEPDPASAFIPPMEQPRSEVPPAAGSLRYELALPRGGSRGAPLILFLHGTGGVRAVWNGWATAAQSRGYIVCLPVASGTGAGDAKSGNRGNDSARRWADVDVAKLCTLAQKLVKSLGADPNSVYLFGYSNGAFYAQEAGLRHPEIFSAIVSIGGGCNVFQFPPGAKQMGVYMIHGTADRAVPVEVARQSAERLRNAGITDVVLKLYPDRGHELFEDEMAAVFSWLEGRMTGGE